MACPGKVVTYTCTVRQEAVLDWIVEPFLPASACIQFLTTRPIRSSLDCNDTSTLQCADLDFVATLTNFTNPTTVPGGTVADIHCCSQTEWDSGAVQRINCSWVSSSQQHFPCCRCIYSVYFVLFSNCFLVPSNQNSAWHIYRIIKSGCKHEYSTIYCLFSMQVYPLLHGLPPPLFSNMVRTV